MNVCPFFSDNQPAQGLAHNARDKQCHVDLGNQRLVPLPEEYVTICRTQFPQCPTFAAIVNAREQYRWAMIHEKSTR
ncbi:MAG TPA: hypothetical protein DD856_08080 [Sulfobacillus sp.]|nr:hypothetical protein [Sulfobacillus sp.]